MNILALDLGTKTGWAFYWEPMPGITSDVTSGTWVLATDAELRDMRKKGEHRCCDPRFGALNRHLEAFKQLDYIFFEDVEFIRGRGQAQLWGGFRALVTLLHPRIKIKTVSVSTLKKFATGKGTAKKEHMAAHLEEKTGISPEGRDDNEVDALHLLNFALTELDLKK